MQPPFYDFQVGLSSGNFEINNFGITANSRIFFVNWVCKNIEFPEFFEILEIFKFLVHEFG